MSKRLRRWKKGSPGAACRVVFLLHLRGSDPPVRHFTGFLLVHRRGVDVPLVLEVRQVDAAGFRVPVARAAPTAAGAREPGWLAPLKTEPRPHLVLPRQHLVVLLCLGMRCCWDRRDGQERPRLELLGLDHLRKPAGGRPFTGACAREKLSCLPR